MTIMMILNIVWLGLKVVGLCFMILLILLVLGCCYHVAERHVFMWNSPVWKIPGIENKLLLKTCFSGTAVIPEVAKKRKGFLSFTEWTNENDLRLFRRFGWLGRCSVVSYDASVFQHVLKGNGAKRWKKGGFQEAGALKFLLGGTSMILNDGEIHKVHRSIGSKAFKQSILNAYIPVVQHATKRLVNLWNLHLRDRNNMVSFVHNDLSHLTLEVITKFCLNVDSNALTKESFLRLVFDRLVRGEDFTGIRFRRLPFALYLPSFGHVRFFMNLWRLGNYIDETVENRSKDQSENCEDYLSILLRAHQLGLISRKEIRHEVMTLLLAGHETSANALEWILYLLATHLDVQEKVRAEAKHIIGDMSEKSLSNLSYTKAAVLESLRLYPSVPCLLRKNTEEDNLLGYVIPKGIDLVLNILAMHRDSEYWEKPEEYRPNRFLNDDLVPWNAFMPFGDGVHKCLGYQFALQEMIIIISILVQNYEFKYESKVRIVPEAIITIVPSPPLRLTIYKV